MRGVKENGVEQTGVKQGISVLYIVESLSALQM